MGHVPPPPPVMPPAPPVPVDLSIPRHREAWAAFEAEREVDCMARGVDYDRSDVCALMFYAGRVSPKRLVPPWMPPPPRLYI